MSTAANAADHDTQIKELLASTSGRWRTSRWFISALALVLLGTAGYWWYARNNSAAAPRFRTQAVTVGKLVVRISATGNLQPTNQVDVGSELSGVIQEVFVDDNDRVKQGQILARLDLSKLQDAVAKSRANLAAADAQVQLAQATAEEAHAQLGRFRQVAELSGGKVPSKSEMDVAQATLKRAEATEASARATVAQMRASLKSDETNLAKGQVRSPINGVVLTRKVEPGQTVAASFQAPVLFTLAEDLSKMELQVDVDEADVGKVQSGQQATFSVDAWPGRRYAAVITRVGYGSKVKEGVVSYPAVLQVDNTDLSLRPGMTGTAEITTLTRENVLRVPNAALRFTPPANDAPAKAAGSSNPLVAMMPRPPASPRKPAAPQPQADGTQRLWVLQAGQPVSLQIKVGATDGQLTEVVGGDLQAGMEVITEAVIANRS